MVGSNYLSRHLDSGTMMPTQSTTTYKRGDVELVPFPFTDLTDVRQRPAVVISSDWFNQERPNVVLSAIISQVPIDLDRDEIKISRNDLPSTGLPRISMIRAGKLFSIDKAIVRRKMGALPSHLLVELDIKLKDVI